ncbi:hypothetical protein MLD38_024173 [Melastoma candidum]|uniref:Uncharacterized protein n=1 Tax=Melastoma candidum TaxID=119954 RepID=A0ACB9NRI5_9MYRT|nr:hypothetical protein MLD38_024173 [Melastoma candidum]
MGQDSEKFVYEEEHVTNSRGLKLFTCRWIPRDREAKALVFICHGYAMECSITMKSTAVQLVDVGYAVYGIDYEGHGKSEGLMGFINNFDDIVDDCSKHFTSISEKKENRGKTRFLLGDSMGGAIALFLHMKNPEFWDGAVLSAPMCKISDDMRPHPVVTYVLTQLCKLIPTWKVIPSPDIIDLAFKDPDVRAQVRANPYCYKGKPRLKTGYEFLRISVNLEKRLSEVTIPFIVLHGEEDRIADKSVSKDLYNMASSSDKMFVVYPGMWHGLLYGETPQNIKAVFEDIIRWMDNRCLSRDSRLEKELKNKNDNGVPSK